MTKRQWKNRITEACKEAGTYEVQFNHCIDTLAEILEKRDEVEEVYKKEGSQPIIMHENKGGGVNPTKNPALVMWDDLTKSALAYWRDLGLTPAGLKKLKGEETGTTKASPLVVALNNLDE